MLRPNPLAFVVGILIVFSAPWSWAQGWTVERVSSFGSHADLAVDATGHPHIIFNNCTVWEYCESDGPPELTYGTNDGTGWSFEPIAGDPGGFFTSILVDSGGMPHVAFCDSSGQMHYGFRDGNDWIIEDLYHENLNYYRASPSLALDAAGAPHIAFIEREKVRHASKENGLWSDEYVAGSWLDNWSARAAIAVDRQGTICIGTLQYYASAQYFTRVDEAWISELLNGASGYNPWMVMDDGDFAHFVYHGTGLFYATNKSGDWVEESIDPTGANEDNDLALDGTGRPFVAYSRAILISLDPIQYDVELFLAWPEESEWVTEPIDALSAVESGSMHPRLEIDGSGIIHLLYRRPSSGELVYGTRPVPSAVGEVPSQGRADHIVGITPNPFNPTTEIVFSLTADENVTLEVYDLSGRSVRHLVSARLTQGEHSLVWDGRADSGKVAPSGVYFFRLQTARGVDSRRGVMIK